MCASIHALVLDVSKCLCLCLHSIPLEDLIPCHLADLGDRVYHLPHLSLSLPHRSTPLQLLPGLHAFLSFSFLLTPASPSLRYIQSNTHSLKRWLLKVILPQPLSEAKINMDQWRYELCTYNAIGMIIAEVSQPLMSRGVGVHFHQWFRI